MCFTDNDHDMLSHLDTRVLARCPVNVCAYSLLQDGAGVIIITGHVIRLHQLLVAEEGILAETEHKLEALRDSGPCLALLNGHNLGLRIVACW